MSNIVGLRGDEFLAPGIAHPETAKLAEEILEMARSGEIQGLTAILSHHDAVVSARRTGRISYALLGIMASVAHDIVQDIKE
jgi:hypothetical protein